MNYIKERAREDLTYLEEKGVVDTFKFAARILQKEHPDAEVVVVKPSGPRQIPSQVNLELVWNFREGRWSSPRSRCTDYDYVYCRIERDEAGRVEGLRLGFAMNQVKLLPDPLDLSLLTQHLFDSIKNPQLAMSTDRHPSWRTRGRIFLQRHI